MDSNSVAGPPSSLEQRKPYHAYVHSLSDRWLKLRHLDQFMDPGSSEFPEKGSIKHRISIIEDIESNQSVTEVYDAAGLEAFLDSSSAQRNRLIIVENLSKEIVEILGQRFDVDPTFFASYIYALDWFGRASSPTTVPLRHSNIRKQSFVQLRYLEARTVKIDDQDSAQPIERLLCVDSNILRKVSLMNLGSTSNSVGFARRQIALWMDPKDSDILTGIILVDPSVKLDPVSKLQWLSDGRPEFLPQPSFSSYAGIEKRSPDHSTYSAILYYFKSCFQNLDFLNMPDFYSLAMNCILEIATVEWLNVSHIVECELMRLDFAQEFHGEPSFDSLQRDLFSLHMWRRRCTKYAEFIEEAEFAFFEGRSRWKSSNLGMDTAFERSIDTNELVRSFKRLSHQADSLTTVIQGRISVEIGKQSVVEAHRVTRLTIVALVFLPLSFVASLLSMSDHFSLNSSFKWVFFAIAIPLSMLVTFAGLYTGKRKIDLQQKPRSDQWDSTMLVRIGMSY